MDAFDLVSKVYRTMEPDGQGVTHGKTGKGRRIDTFGGPLSWLTGPFGIVAHRELSPRATAYSYLDTSTRQDAAEILHLCPTSEARVAPSVSS
eukprot:scaffold128404_cov121-Phaeocystis_antarctica.AAC.1